MRSHLSLVFVALLSASPAIAQDWPQWGFHPQHGSNVPYVGQSLNQNLANVLYDPLVEEELEQALALGDEPLLLAHFQTPLIDGDDVYMMTKSSDNYNIEQFNTQNWAETKYTWNASHTALEVQWRFDTDWKAVGGIFTNWEGVFHPALTDKYLYVPGAGGSVFRVNKKTGHSKRITPFDGALNPKRHVISPITVDSAGSLYYSVAEFEDDVILILGDVTGAWLVKITTPNNHATVADWATLTAGAPAGTDQCSNQFRNVDLPWPTSPDAVAPTRLCGTQRSGLNAAPAVAPDGTIYLISRAHFIAREGYLVAVNPNLTQKWIATLRDRFNDGCGVPLSLGGTLPATGAPGGCKAGAHYGVDPATNRPGGGIVEDSSTASPVVAPDGTIWYGAFTRYNYAQGHMMHFGADGSYLGAYQAGWDVTPGIWPHDGAYSVLIKENRYGETGSYCNNPAFCPTDASGRIYNAAFYVTQISLALRADALADRGDKVLTRDWWYKNTNTKACSRDALGNVSCVEDPGHPNSFEFCINGFTIDANGTVYGTAEDGWLYKIQQGGIVNAAPGCGTTIFGCGGKIFQQLTLGQAYSPTAMDATGRVYSLNAGYLYVSGN
jgi:hypothetical protein